MDEVVIIVPWKLLRTCGPDWLSVLGSLQEEGILKSYDLMTADEVKLSFYKDQAVHIQTVLEFFETKDTPSGRNPPVAGNKLNEED